jgi:hypothetical protein
MQPCRRVARVLVARRCQLGGERGSGAGAAWFRVDRSDSRSILQLAACSLTLDHLPPSPSLVWHCFICDVQHTRTDNELVILHRDDSRPAATPAQLPSPPTSERPFSPHRALATSPGMTAAAGLAGIDEKETVSIGIIGMGEMGKMYADRLAKGGWKR